MRVTVGELVLDLNDAQVDDLRQQLGVETVTGCDGFLTTAQAAERLGFSTDYVRDHAVELGGVKLTDSPKSQWRFDPAKLVGADQIGSAPTLSPQRRRAPRRAGTGQLLQVRR